MCPVKHEIAQMGPKQICPRQTGPEQTNLKEIGPLKINALRNAFAQSHFVLRKCTAFN